MNQTIVAVVDVAYWGTKRTSSQRFATSAIGGKGGIPQLSRDAAYDPDCDIERPLTSLGIWPFQHFQKVPFTAMLQCDARTGGVSALMPWTAPPPAGECQTGNAVKAPRNKPIVEGLSGQVGNAHLHWNSFPGGRYAR